MIEPETIQEEANRQLQRLTPLFNKMKHYNSKQIGDILVNAHNNGLLSITGGLFEQEDTDECYVAFMIAIGMLKDNDIKLADKYLEEGEMNEGTNRKINE